MLLHFCVRVYVHLYQCCRGPTNSLGNSVPLGPKFLGNWVLREYCTSKDFGPEGGTEFPEYCSSLSARKDVCVSNKLTVTDHVSFNDTYSVIMHCFIQFYVCYICLVLCHLK